MNSTCLLSDSSSSVKISISKFVKLDANLTFCPFRPFARPNFKKGVARIYNELNINCLPVTINSGEMWPKNGDLKKNKNITITILKPIRPGLEGKEFLNSLQSTMYEVLNKTSSPSSA